MRGNFVGLSLFAILASVCAAQAQQRIPANKVTLGNVEAFEKQVARDLPVGTPKDNVEAYLIHEKITHSFYSSDPIYGPDGNTFQGTIRNIGVRLIFEGDLAIRIHLNAQDKVDKVWFRIDYDAP